MLEVILAILGSSTVSSAAAYLFARRKNKADAQLTEFDLVQEAITIWREQAESLKEQIEQLRAENKALRCEIAKLRRVNEKFVRALEDATPENLAAIIEELKNNIHD